VALPWALASFALSSAADGADSRWRRDVLPTGRDQADAARGGMQEDGIAGFDAIGLAIRYCVVRPFSIMAAAVLSSMPSGSSQAIRPGSARYLGIGADRRGAIGDAVAGLQIRSRRGPLQDHAGRSRRARSASRGIKAGAVVDVDEIQADRGMADFRLPGPGLPTSTSSQTKTSGPPVFCESGWRASWIYSLWVKHKNEKAG